MKIELKKVISHPDRKIPEEYVDQLAASYKETGGWMQPIGIREFAGSFTVIWGKSRFAAMQKMGLQELDSEKGDFRLVDSAVTDQQLAFLENFHRRQMTIEEEVKLLEKLREESNDPSVSALEKLLGKPRKWILTRLNLSNLHASFRKRLSEKISAEELEGLEELAKYPKEMQHDVPFRNFSKEEIRRFFRNHEKDLTKAYFESARICANCPKRNENDLFDEEAGKKCFDGKCYDRKTAEALFSAFTAAKEKDPNLFPVLDMWYLPQEFKGLFKEKEVLAAGDYKKNPKGGAAGFFLDGPGRGKVVKITLSQKVKEKVQKAAASKKRTAADQFETLTKKRIKEAAELLQKQIEIEARNFDGEHVPNGVCDSISFFCLPLILKYGYYGNSYTPIRNFLSDSDAANWKKLGSYLIRQMEEDIGKQVKYIPLSQISERDFCDLADHIGIDWENLMKKAEEKLPIPEKLKKELEKERKKK